MSDKKLESFKVGERRKPTVTSPAKVKEEAEQPSTSLGFSRIEGMLDNEAPDDVRASMASIMSGLEAYEAKAVTAKDKTAAKKAKLAVEQTVAILEFLFQTRENMMAAASTGETNKSG